MAGDLSEISKALEEYTEDVSEAIKQSAIDIGTDGVKALKTTKLPKKTGAYRRGWKKKVKSGANFINVKIHNAKHYRLTHLLEYGHATSTGSRTKAIPHIAPVEKTIQVDFVKEVETIIANGG